MPVRVSLDGEKFISYKTGDKFSIDDNGYLVIQNSNNDDLAMYAPNAYKYVERTDL